MISEQSSALAAVVRDLGCCDVLMERSCGVNVGVGAEPLVEQGWLQSSFDMRCTRCFRNCVDRDIQNLTEL
jgi:hypothetical protein